MSKTLPLASSIAFTRKGSGHFNNDDSYRVLDGSQFGRGFLFAVADGVSTVKDGGWASKITCERLGAFFEADLEPSLDSLLQVVHEIDWELRGRGMGKAACTLAIVWLTHGKAKIVSVGDSAIFRVRSGEITSLTSPSVSKGGLRSYMGMGRKLSDSIWVTEKPLFDGDLYILATDGVTSCVDSNFFVDSWITDFPSIEQFGNSLMERIESMNGMDDATMIIVDVLSREVADILNYQVSNKFLSCQG